MLPHWIEHSHTYFADVAQREEERRRLEARASLTVSDVLSEVQHLAFGVKDDAHHPLYALIAACVAHGTPQESGVQPHVAAHVGAAWLPLIERAIGRLTQEKLLEGWPDAAA